MNLMGLDTSHGCWHGSYSAFTIWRNAVAVAAGYELMDAASGLRHPRIEWSGVEQRNLMGEWDRTPPDPLLVLIAHSDCDGVIHPAQAGPLAGRLEELLPFLEDNVWMVRHAYYTEQFIEGLREAVKAGEDVEFN